MNIYKTDNMAKLEIDLSGRGGLAPRFWGDSDRTTATPELRYLGGANQIADGIYNPFRRYGYMSPANATTATLTYTGGTHDAIMGSSIYDISNDDFYFAERGQQIFKGDGLDDIILAQVLDLTSTGTPVLMDLEIYQLNGVQKLFYVYEKSGNMEIGEADLPFASANNNWLTADVSGSFTNALTNDAFMRVADNGFAYIFQNNNIHKLDGTTNGGTNGTVSANVLQFPTFFGINDAIDYRGNMYVAIRQDTSNPAGNNNAVFSSKVGVYIWDRLTSIVRTRDFIPLEGVKYIRKIYVSPEGDLRMICVNTERITQIRQFTGSTFKVIEEPGLLADFTYHDGLTTFSNFTTWMGDTGNIYAHGKISHLDKEVLYKIGNISDVNSTSPTGAILFGGANTDSGSAGFKGTKNALYIGYNNNSSTKKVVEWDIYGTGSDGVTALQEQGDVYTLVKYLPQMSTVNFIDIYMAALSTSGSTTQATLKIYFNGSTTQWASKVVTRDDIAKGYIRIDIDKPYINSIQIETEFPTAVAIGTTDYSPSIAVVDYTPTGTKG